MAGVYCFTERTSRVSREGIYEMGLAIIQCAYAQEYVSRSASTIVKVSKRQIWTHYFTADLRTFVSRRELRKIKNKKK